jgi:hypothetical protein
MMDSLVVVYFGINRKATCIFVVAFPRELYRCHSSSYRYQWHSPPCVSVEAKTVERQPRLWPSRLLNLAGLNEGIEILQQRKHHM